jgi:hypothetical protein
MVELAAAENTTDVIVRSILERVAPELILLVGSRAEAGEAIAAARDVRRMLLPFLVPPNGGGT